MVRPTRTRLVYKKERREGELDKTSRRRDGELDKIQENENETRFKRMRKRQASKRSKGKKEN